MATILFLCHRVPYPPDKGDKIRSWHMLQHLCRGHDVHLGCFIDDPADAAHLPFLRGLCRSVCAVPLPRWRRLAGVPRGLAAGQPVTVASYDHPALWRWLAQATEQQAFDGVVAFSGAMAPYAQAARAGRRVLDLVDVDSLKWPAYAEHARWPASWLYKREGRTLLAFERAMAARFDATLFVSDAEAARFRQLAPEAADRVGSLEMGVDAGRFSPAPFPNPFAPQVRAIVFTGTMDYWPNIDAVCWFAREVLPGIRARHPAAEFHIVGARPTAGVRRLARLSGVHVTGRVADTRPFLAHAALVVAPLRIARGVQSKVLEALAMARPVLVSPDALEGLRVSPGRDLLLASGADATVRAACDVLDGRHEGLGARARATVLREYGWPQLLAPLDRLLGNTSAPLSLAAAAE